MEDILNMDGQKRAIALFNFIVLNCAIANRRGITSEEVQNLCEKVTETLDELGVVRGELVVVLGTMLLTYLEDYEKQLNDFVREN